MTASNPRRVLVTGAAGAIGRACCKGLIERGHAVVGVDLAEASPPGLTEYARGDLNDRPLLNRLCASVDHVIHLAAIPTEADFLTGLLPSNYTATYKLFEAAREADVDRLITVSSSQVILGNEHETQQVSVEAPFAPLNHYAVSKVWMEAMARMYVQVHGMSILVVRPGWLARGRKDFESIGRTKRTRGMYWSQDDAARFFACAVESAHPGKPGIATVYSRSRSEDEAVGFDPNPARNLLQYEAQDIYPQGSAFD